MSVRITAVGLCLFVLLALTVDAAGPKATTAFTASLLHQSAVITVDDAAIRALPTQAIEIVPSPGVGRIVIPQTVAIRTVFPNQVTYSNLAPSAYFRFQMGVNGDAFAYLPAGQVGAQVLGDYYNPSAFTVFTFPTIDIPSWSYFYTKDLADGAFAIGITNAGQGDLTDGDQANSLKVVATYLILNTATGQFE